MQLWFSYQKLAQMQLLRGRDSTVVWCLPWAACGVLYIPQMQLCRGHKGHQGPEHTTNATLQRSPNHSCVSVHAVFCPTVTTKSKYWTLRKVCKYLSFIIYGQYLKNTSWKSHWDLAWCWYHPPYLHYIRCLVLFTRPDCGIERVDIVSKVLALSLGK